MNTVEEGVSNFRDHSVRVEAFINRYEAKQEERDKTDRRRARIHYALLTLLCTVVAGAVVAVFELFIKTHHVVTTWN